MRLARQAWGPRAGSPSGGKVARTEETGVGES